MSPTLIVILLSIVSLIAVNTWDATKEEESIAKTNRKVLSDIRNDISNIVKRSNEINADHYSSKERITALELKIEGYNKKMNDIDYLVSKPRNVNVHLPKGLTLKTEEPIKFLGGVRTKALPPVLRKKPTIRKKKLKSSPVRKKVRSMKKSL